MNLSLTQRRNYFKVIDMVASQLLTMQILTTQLLTTVASQLLQRSDLIQCRSKLDNWGGGGGAHIHIFVFCVINFF